MLRNVISTTIGLLLFSGIPNTLSGMIFPLKIDRRAIIQYMQNIRNLTQSSIAQIHNGFRVMRFQGDNRVSASIRNKPGSEILKELFCTNHIKRCILPASQLVQAQSSITVNIPAIHVAHKFLWNLWSNAYLCLLFNNAKSFSGTDQLTRCDKKARHRLSIAITTLGSIVTDWVIRLKSISKSLYVNGINSGQAHTNTWCSCVSPLAIAHAPVCQEKAYPISTLFIQWLIKVRMVTLINAVKLCGILSSCNTLLDKCKPNIGFVHPIGFSNRYSAFTIYISLANFFSLFCSKWFPASPIRMLAPTHFAIKVQVVFGTFICTENFMGSKQELITLGASFARGIIRGYNIVHGKGPSFSSRSGVFKQLQEVKFERNHNHNSWAQPLARWRVRRAKPKDHVCSTRDGQHSASGRSDRSLCRSIPQSGHELYKWGKRGNTHQYVSCAKRSGGHQRAGGRFFWGKCNEDGKQWNDARTRSLRTYSRQYGVNSVSN